MKTITLAIVVVLLFTTTAKSQSTFWDTLPFKQQADYKLANLSVSVGSCRFLPTDPAVIWLFYARVSARTEDPSGTELPLASRTYHVSLPFFYIGVT